MKEEWVGKNVSHVCKKKNLYKKSSGWFIGQGDEPSLILPF